MLLMNNSSSSLWADLGNYNDMDPPTLSKVIPDFIDLGVPKVHHNAQHNTSTGVSRQGFAQDTKFYQVLTLRKTCERFIAARLLSLGDASERVRLKKLKVCAEQSLYAGQHQPSSRSGYVSDRQLEFFTDRAVENNRSAELLFALEYKISGLLPAISLDRICRRYLKTIRTHRRIRSVPSSLMVNEMRILPLAKHLYINEKLSSVFECKRLCYIKVVDLRETSISDATLMQFSDNRIAMDELRLDTVRRISSVGLIRFLTAYSEKLTSTKHASTSMGGNFSIEAMKEAYRKSQPLTLRNLSLKYNRQFTPKTFAHILCLVDQLELRNLNIVGCFTTRGIDDRLKKQFSNKLCHLVTNSQ
mmetsp:Transcript_9008/g.13632  ORF Transcript_9008/g.13632 Transcript_9008/m.13632 type:complete len:359 (+) Transcript_9008:34-1110(+)